MNKNLVSAVFDTRSEAERAVTELSSAGLSDGAISIVARHDGTTTTTDGGGGEATRGFIGKTAAGAGVGTILGIAALAIPGVGPFVAAGAIASAAIPAAAVTGAALGAAAGGLGALLTSHGVSDEDATYYEGRINDGGVFVSADTDDADLAPDAASDILYRHGGHSSARAKTMSTM